MARNNKAFNITEIQRLTEEGINQIDSQKWLKVVNHTKKVIIDAWEKEGSLEIAVEQLIIENAGADSSSDDNEEEDYLLEEDYMSSNIDLSSEKEDKRLANEIDCSGEEDVDISGILPLPSTSEKVLDFKEF